MIGQETVKRAADLSRVRLASHRRTIYRRAETTSVALTPIVTGRSLGARTTIGW